MKPLIKLKTTTLLVIPLLLACFALLPSVQATPDPGAVGGGNSNAADGFGALNATVSGIHNSGFGANALHNLTTGNNNAAQGNSALFSNLDGNNNTALGVLALRLSQHGSNNTAVGFEAIGGSTAAVNFNTAIGFGTLRTTTGSFNTALGFNAGFNITTGSFNIDIGNGGVPAESSTIRIGSSVLHIRTFIAGINGVNQGSPTPVFINTTTGQLGTTPPASSRRFKKEIQPMDQTSEGILQFKPVTFHYKSDTKDTPQFGLIAEEVAAVNPDLVVRDEKGEIYSVRYDAVNAMLLNEFLKEHRKVEALQASFAQQQKDFQASVAQQQKQIEALSEGLQKVSAQVEMNRTAPQMVGNNR